MAFKNECAVRNKFFSLIVSSFYVVGCKSFKQGFGVNKSWEVWSIDYSKYNFQSYSSKDFVVFPQLDYISGMILIFHKNVEKIIGFQNFDTSTTLKLVLEWHRAVIVFTGFGTLCYIQNYKKQVEICS